MHNIFVFGKSQQCQPFPVVIQVKVLMYKTGRNSHVNITAGRSPFFAGLFIRGSYNSTTQRKGKFNSIPAYHTSYCHALRYFSGEYSGLRDSITAVLDTELIRVARSGWFDISSNGSGQLRVATTTFDSLLGQVRGSSPRIFVRRRYFSRGGTLGTILRKLGCQPPNIKENDWASQGVAIAVAWLCPA